MATGSRFIGIAERRKCPKGALTVDWVILGVKNGHIQERCQKFRSR